MNPYAIPFYPAAHPLHQPIEFNADLSPINDLHTFDFGTKSIEQRYLALYAELERYQACHISRSELEESLAWQQEQRPPILRFKRKAQAVFKEGREPWGGLMLTPLDLYPFKRTRTGIDPIQSHMPDFAGRRRDPSLPTKGMFKEALFGGLFSDEGNNYQPTDDQERRNYCFDPVAPVLRRDHPLYHMEPDWKVDRALHHVMPPYVRALLTPAILLAQKKADQHRQGKTTPETLPPTPPTVDAQQHPSMVPAQYSPGPSVPNPAVHASPAETPRRRSGNRKVELPPAPAPHPRGEGRPRLWLPEVLPIDKRDKPMERVATGSSSGASDSVHTPSPEAPQGRCPQHPDVQVIANE